MWRSKGQHALSVMLFLHNIYVTCPNNLSKELLRMSAFIKGQLSEAKTTIISVSLSQIR